MMAMGVLSFSENLTKWVACSALAIAFTLPASAEDQLKLNSGQVMNGQVLGYSNGQIMFATKTASGGTAKLPYRDELIATITMDTPAAVAQVKGAKPEAVVAALEPLVKQFAGLKVPWVTDAMGQLADAYNALTPPQTDKAAAIYTQIDDLYPGSKYHYQAVAGRARIKVQQGKADEAIKDLQPIIDEANKNLAPSQSEGGFYATVFIVYGQALESQKQFEKALEAYLTVKTMFYQNPALAEQSDQFAKKLREQHPDVGVE